MPLAFAVHGYQLRMRLIYGVQALTHHQTYLPQDDPSPHDRAGLPGSAAPNVGSWKVILLTRDLMIASRIEHAMRSAGLLLRIVPDIDVALAAVTASDQTCRHCVVIDLTSFPDAASIIAERTQSLRTESLQNGRIVMIGFGPHVATGTLAEAKSAGCTAVFARGQFLARSGELTTEVLRLSETEKSPL